MYRKTYTILIATVLLVTHSFFTMAQTEGAAEDFIRLSGQIVKAKDSLPIPYVHIINVSSNIGTVSDEQGYFNIRMKPSDTLVFTSVAFEEYNFNLKKKMDEVDEDSFVRIILNPSTYKLDVVDIYAFKSAADFKREIAEMELDENKTIIRIPTPRIVRRPPEGFGATGSGVGWSGPFTSLKNLLSRKHRIEQRGLKAIEEDVNIRLVKIAEEVTGYEEEELDQFLDYCNLPIDFIKRSNEYDITVAVMECHKRYLAKKK